MHRLMLTAVLTLSSLALAGTWDIDPDHARATFRVKHLGITNVDGLMGKIAGTVTLDDKDVTKSTVEATIDVKAINTGVTKRDDHLRSPDFFDVEKFPSITFKSTKVAKGGAGLLVTGTLTMHGVTKPVTLDVELSGEVDHPFKPGAKVRAASATTKVKREDFGLTWSVPGNSLVVGSEVKIALEIELVKAGAAPAKKK